ncbi:NADPH:quinone oxidoreductase family protein [Phenylobacterium sp.]|uniref:NADPH:quinone oxidoreductase family protein n=1 Tax=Phenylobacterium sp. TaxID=1871053 RepID=UPI0035AF0E44
MKAWRAETLESIDDYRLVDLPLPEPAKGQARIRVRACGVGYVDALVSLGRYQVKPPLPHTPGGEIAGVIDALGEGVEGLAVGQRVMAQAAGGFAEYALAPAASVVPLPDKLDFAAASGLRINYLTALHGLRQRAMLRPGERLLVLGAAGGVGAAAVQVGRLLGAQVVAAASTEAKRAFCLEHGADQAIDTDPEGWRDRLKALTEDKGPDVVFDPVCGPLFQPAFRSLAWGGRHLVVGFAGGPIPALPANLPLMKGAALIGVDVRQFLLFEVARARTDLADLMAWIAEGRLSPPVGRVFTFDQGREALEFALSGQGAGKTVLAID